MVHVQAGGDSQLATPPKGATAAAGAPDPSSALLHSLRSWRDASRAAAAAAAAPPASGPHSRRGAPTSGGGGTAAPPAAANSGLQVEGGKSVEPLTLDGFRIMLGPDLRVAWFPFLQVSLNAPHLELSGPTSPERLQVFVLSP